jgi:hypothetical protein
MTRCRPARSWPPKGAYPHPAGGYIGPTRTHRGIQVTTHLRAEPDTKRLALTVIELARQLGKRR